MPFFGTKKAPEQPQGDDARFERLEQALAGLADSVAKQSQTTQNFLASLAMRGEPQQEPQRAAPQRVNTPAVNTAGLPNPAEDPDGFSKGLTERVLAAANGMVAGTLTAQQQQQQEQAAYVQQQQQFWDGLDEEFAERFKDLADNEEVVGAAAKKVMKRIERRGFDLNKYVRTDPDGWLNAVAEEARVMVRAAQPDVGDGEGDDDGMGNGAAEGAFPAHGSQLGGKKGGKGNGAGDDVDPFRAMVLGDSGGKPVSRAKPNGAADAGSLAADLMSEQKRLGLK